MVGGVAGGEVLQLLLMLVFVGWHRGEGMVVCGDG